MSNIKNLATSVKFWLGFAVVFFATLAALGATIDRPAWISELHPIAVLAASNAKGILQLEIDQVRRRVWVQEDRLDIKSTQDGKQRLRELKGQLRRLIEEMETAKQPKR